MTDHHGTTVLLAAFATGQVTLPAAVKMSAERHLRPDSIGGPEQRSCPALIASGVTSIPVLGDIVPAVAVGIEIAHRLHEFLGPALGREGWDPCSVAVVCGAAAATGRLLGLGTEAIARALSIAATQAAGLKPSGDEFLVDYQRERARHNGVEAALLASAGLSAPVTGIEGRRGLMATMTPNLNPATPIAAGLGKRWLSDVDIAPCLPSH